MGQGLKDHMCDADEDDFQFGDSRVGLPFAMGGVAPESDVEEEREKELNPEDDPT
jgi:hypothetical protein